MASPGGPSTFFLSPERATPALLAEQVARAACNPLVDALLHDWPGAVAVLNGHRQLVALNDCYLAAIGVRDPGTALGLRPGEAIGCDRAWDGPGGCGTGPSCPGCGAAIAIVSAMGHGQPREADCVLTVERDGEPLDLIFRVRASPLEVDQEQFVVLCLADVSEERRRAALDQAFLHDMANLASGLSGCVSWAREAPAAERPGALADLEEASAQLGRAIQVQRALDTPRGEAPPLQVEPVAVELLVGQLRALFLHHPQADGRHLVTDAPAAGLVLETDALLLHRVLANMLVNALEASPPGGEVRLGAEPRDGQVRFSVWNAGAIPAQAARRVFQRYFSTKEGIARGQGTFVMKLLGERALGGRVSFESTVERGTTFTLVLPRRPPGRGQAGGPASA